MEEITEASREDGLSTTEVLELFGPLGLTRDLLYFWEKVKWIGSHRVPRKELNRRRFPPDEVRKIGVLLRCRQLGLTPDAAYEVLTLQRTLSAPRLQALLKASQSLARNSFLGDWEQPPLKKALETITGIVKTVMDCEACSVLLPREDAPGEFAIAVQVGVTGEADRTKTFRAHEQPGGGLTGFILNGGALATFSGRELREHPYGARTPPTHLPSGQCASLLMAPVRDRKQRVLAWIRAENRLGPEGIPRDCDFFDPLDETIAEILAGWIGIVIENVRLLEASGALLACASSAPKYEIYLGELLKQSMDLLGADRGDVYWFSTDHRQLTMAAMLGPSDDTVKVRGALPAPGGVVGWVFDEKQPRVIPDVRKEPRYVACCERTLSELAVPLMVGNTAVGVLNVESFALAHFDEKDIGVLRHLAAHAVPTSQAIESFEKVFQRLLAQTVNPAGQPIDAHQAILDSLHEKFGLDGGVVYVVEEEHRQLRAKAVRSHLAAPPAHLVLSFDDQSFATRIFHARCGCFTESPATDVSVDPRELFDPGAASGLVGVPLLLGAKVVGVLVAWASSPQVARPQERDKKALEDYAQLVVTSFVISQAEIRRREGLAQIQRVMRLLQEGNLPEDRIVREILEGVVRSHFKRARLFKYEENRHRFVCLDSYGIDEPGAYTGVPVDTSGPYAAQTIDEWKRGDLGPKVRTPDKMFGPDPNARALKKPANLTWAIAPMVVGGRLFGYLAADNVPSAEIGLEALETLAVFAAIAAHGIASRNSDAGAALAEV
jgi:putative methionine-R-sulfoxide reductase with GAF domain/DNA-binding transcriptional MerR regulator